MMMQDFTPHWNDYTEAQLLTAFFLAAQHHQAAIAVWNEPTTQQLYLLVSFSEPLACQLSEKLAAGFIVNSFNNDCFFLPAQLLYCFNNQQLSEKNVLQSAQSENFLTTLSSYLTSQQPNKPFIATAIPNNPIEDKNAFITLVEKGLEQIKTGALQKVVLARTKTIDLPTGFNLINTFQALRTTYPQHFVSLLSTPDYGTWLGCSPELLLKINGQELLTVALAGTKLNSQDWTAKEYEEQALVTEFIRQQLQGLGVSDFSQTLLSNLHSGALKHLQTQFKIHLSPQQSVNQIAEKLLTLLHPTPAICGLPKQQALNCIQHYESFNRQLYAGYLGPHHIHEGETQLYVNIRCMQLFAGQAVLYAGAGITLASDPEKEWEETNLKCQTLLDFCK
jgi:isochorismate synthase